MIKIFDNILDIRSYRDFSSLELTKTFLSRKAFVGE